MTAAHELRPEIQGLRAVAVSLVLIFHLWPEIIPAGYIGVDVFFVISGYLITGSLTRNLITAGTVDVLDFYARRVRRLMPAAMSVLLFTLIGSWIWLPEARWAETLTQIAAAAFYAQNWYLAWESVDYLASENVPSPLQHYWSLSIEEQFYIVLPIVLAATIGITQISTISRKAAVLTCLAVIFTCSLAASVYLTVASPAEAYFATYTRVWELAAGGLAAVAIPRLQWSPGARACLFAGGMTAVLLSAFLLDRSSPFPGWIAVFPVAGTIAAIVAGDFRVGIFAGVNFRAARYLGDISYSLYLWHWPIVIFYVVTPRTLGWIEGIGILAIILAVSHLSYHYIEQPFRASCWRTADAGRSILAGIGSIAACGAVVVGTQQMLLSQSLITVDTKDPRYPGPGVLAAGIAAPPGVPLLPSLVALKNDLPVSYLIGCHQAMEAPEAVACNLGAPGGKKTIALVGDSHAAQWVPTIDDIAARHGMRLITYTKSACGFAVQNGPNSSCSAWQDNVENEILRLKPVMAFYSQSTGHLKVGSDLTDLIEQRWKRLLAAGIRIIAIPDTPRLDFVPGDCVGETVSTCETPREKALPPVDPIITAAHRMPDVKLVDMTDLICSKSACPATVGNMIVWRDEHHLTATYARAIAPYLETRIEFGTPVARAASAPSDRFKVTFQCDTGGSAGMEPFTRVYVAFFADGQLSLSRGSVGHNGYEKWWGSLTADGKLVIEGEYIEGAGGIKKVAFAAHGHDDGYQGKGTRGPRSCSIDVEPFSQ